MTADAVHEPDDVGGDRAAALRRTVAGRSWYHTLDLGHGVVTPGWFDLRGLPDRLPLPPRLDGKRCLDVGTFDGFWAFTMEARGADEVVATDVPDPEDWDWPAGSPPDARRKIASRQPGSGFEIASTALRSNVRYRRLGVYDLDPDDVGMFDVVYVGSLLVHLRDPVGALERVRAVCRGAALFVDAIDWWLSLRHPWRPLATLDGRDRPWWWLPNRAGLVRMIEAAGFTLARPPQRVWMTPGAGHDRPPLRVRGLRSRVARDALLRSRLGDPHLAVVARPRV